MKYLELEHDTHGHVRIEQNENAMFNFQTPIGGEWVDFHAFTCYGLETEHEAFAEALEALEELEA